jgi:E3 ubiquitin-protein ligase UBR7
VTGEEPAQANKYNQNFRNKFCGCEEDYDPKLERGTMFQCLGLGTVVDGGCGEDWWHPECILGISRTDYKEYTNKLRARKGDTNTRGIMREVSFSRMEEEANGHPDMRRPSIVTAIAAGIANGDGVDGNDIAADVEEEEDDDDEPLPPGFPAEDDFEHFLCYKCVEAHPWIKKYTGAPGFLPPKFFDASLNPLELPLVEDAPPTNCTTTGDSKKRKASDDDEDLIAPSTMAPPKRQKSVDPAATLSAIPENTPTITLPLTPKKSSTDTCKLSSIAPLSGPALTTPFSLFLQPDFRSHLCHCPNCFPLLKSHPQLLEEEDIYEPPVSEAGSPSVGTGSILDRGEAAFSSMDRVRAIQGAMAYANLKDGLQAFFKPFAESGKAVGAEDIKEYFEKLRGDDKGIQEAAGSAKKSKDADGDGPTGGDSRREQSGY